MDKINILQKRITFLKLRNNDKAMIITEAQEVLEEIVKAYPEIMEENLGGDEFIIKLRRVLKYGKKGH